MGAETPGPSTRADEQRRRVVALSAQIFGRRGFRATSMNEIAAAVGLSKPTLYHYFRSKEEILGRIYSDALDESLALARATVAAAPSPFDAIHDLIATRVAYTCRNQQMLTVCFEEENQLPAELIATLSPKRTAFEDIILDALHQHLAHHPDLVLPSPPKVWVNVCLGAANWTYKWYRPDGPATPEDLGRCIADVLTAGIVPPRSTPRS